MENGCHMTDAFIPSDCSAFKLYIFSVCMFPGVRTRDLLHHKCSAVPIELQKPNHLGPSKNQFYSTL